MSEQLANRVKTTLNGAIDNDDTSAIITSATGFPSIGNFRILIQDSEFDETNAELCLVTARSGTTLTVTRGQEGTSGVSHAGGSFVAIVLTKSALENSSEEISGNIFYPYIYFGG